MVQKHVTLPRLGESITTATVVQWFKQEGEFVKEDEPLLEVTTDKINSEIPAPFSGVLKKIMAPPDAQVEVDEPLALFDTDGVVSAVPPSTTESSSFLSPAVVRYAAELKIPISALSRIKGTGAQGRITKKDVEAYAKQTPCPNAPVQEGIERVRMTDMRKAIASNLKRSFYEAPHATLISEADLTVCMQLIAKHKEAFLTAKGFRLTITTFIAKAIAQAVQEFPLINASLEEDTILIKRFVNLGIAVSVEGGILVPVIKGCHLKSLTDIAQAVAKLSDKAREGTLTPDDAREGTITMTNFGMGGTLIGIPIIRYPEVAIIGVGAIHKKVVALDDDSFGVRQIAHISLTFDHRVIDGMYGCGFLAALKKHLEAPAAI